MNIFIFGDFCPYDFSSRIQKRAKSFIGEQLYKQISSAEISILNLETPLTLSMNKLDKTGPCIRTNPIWAELIKNAGFGYVTLANNHIMDYGTQGLRDTLSVLQKHSIGYVGAGESLEQASKPLIIQRDSLKIGLLNFADHEYSIAGNDSPGANPIDIIKNYYAIKQCKSQVDFLFVIVHGGHEYIEYPGLYYRDLLRFYADSGASAVVSHHTHIVSEYEIYNDVPIFYSLGNFYFPWDGNKPDFWYRGIGVEFTIADNMLSFEIIPTTFKNDDNTVEIADEGEANIILRRLTETNKMITNDEMLRNWWDGYYRDNALNRILEFYGTRKVGRLIVRRNKWAQNYLFNRIKLRRLYHLLNCESYRDHMKQVLKRILGYN